MRGQLRHLAEVARLPNVTLQVVPFRIGGHEAAGGAFTVLRFAEPDVPDVVYIEQLTGAMYLEKRSDVDHYLDVSNRLGATSLDPAASMRFFGRGPPRDSDRPGPSPAGGHGLQLVERLPDELRQVSLAGVGHPALERDLEDGDPGLGGQARGRLGDAAPAQRVGERRGERRRA